MSAVTEMDRPDGLIPVTAQSLSELVEEIRRMRGERLVLLAALIPFAEVADHFDIEGLELKDSDGVYANTAGDFRRARAALAYRAERDLTKMEASNG